MQRKNNIDPYTKSPGVFPCEGEVFELADELRIRKLRILLHSPYQSFPTRDIGLDYQYFVGESTLFAPEGQAAHLLLSGSVDDFKESESMKQPYGKDSKER